jgi:hypothetical protein
MSKRQLDALDRHALVIAVWLPLILVAAAAFHYGFGAGGWPFIIAGFGVVIAAFVGHVIVNVAHGTLFTPREIALGLAVYWAGSLAFGLAMLTSPGFRSDWALPVSLGLISTAAAVVVTMIIWLGLRGAFDSFDVIRRFRP